jgi:two-component system, LytTR family, sensor kinase
MRYKDNGAGPTAAGTTDRSLPGMSRVMWVVVVTAILTLLTSSRVILSLEIKGYGAPIAAILAGEALRWALWLPVVPLVLAAERRSGFAAGSWPRAIAMHVVGATAVLLTQSLVMTLAGRSAGWYFALDSARATFLIQVVHEAAATAIVYGAIVAYAHVRRHLHEREARRAAHAGLETLLARERLRVLQMQLHPHFLFNALHAIGGLVRDGDRATAVETVSDLGELLRRSLRHSERSLVTLEEELEFVAAYLKIQQARYGDHLAVSIGATPEARRTLVPTLIVQPLVENAIRHGTARAEHGGRVEIRARCTNDRLEVEVRDDGPAPVEEAPEPGIGLGNTRARLRGTYGEDFGFTLARGQLGGTVAMISIPLRPPDASHA